MGSFSQELDAQRRMADLYKNYFDEATSKVSRKTVGVYHVSFSHFLSPFFLSFFLIISSGD
jgi:hypothetical protein